MIGLCLFASFTLNLPEKEGKKRGRAGGPTTTNTKMKKH